MNTRGPLLPIIEHHQSADAPLDSPQVKSGMGLPYEFWDYIIRLLSLEPYPLLVCCLTCRDFYGHARYMLERLFNLVIPLNKYIDINRFVEDVRVTPLPPRIPQCFRPQYSVSTQFILLH